MRFFFFYFAHIPESVRKKNDKVIIIGKKANNIFTIDLKFNQSRNLTNHKNSPIHYQ